MAKRWLLALRVARKLHAKVDVLPPATKVKPEPEEDEEPPFPGSDDE